MKDKDSEFLAEAYTNLYNKPIVEGRKLRDMSTRDVERGYDNFVNREIDGMGNGEDGEEPEEPRRKPTSNDIADMELLSKYFQQKIDESKDGGVKHYWGGRLGMIQANISYAKNRPGYTMEERMLRLVTNNANKIKRGEELK